MEGVRSTSKVIGLKQCVKAIENNKVQKVFIAKDADDHIKQNLLEICQKNGLDVEYAESMKILGNEAGIDVGTSVVCIKK